MKSKTLIKKISLTVSLLILIVLVGKRTLDVVAISEFRLFPEGTDIHRGFPWRNGDHMYYVSSALQLTGISLRESLIQTGQLFSDWPGDSIGLTVGYFSMEFSPLVFPRFLFPLVLSWGYSFAGTWGMFIVPVLLGCVSLFLLFRWTHKALGKRVAFGTLLAAFSSVLFLKYGFGLFVESIVILIQASWLFLLPIANQKEKINKYFFSVFLLTICLLSLTRQMPALPILVLLCGYLYRVVETRSAVNNWTPYFVVGWIVTVTSYIAVATWAPYDPRPFLVEKMGAPTDSSFALWAIVNVREGLTHTAKNLDVFDPFMFVVIPAALIGGWILRRSALPYVALGAWLAAATNTALNFPEYRFWATGILFSLPLAGLGLVSAFTYALNQIRKLQSNPSNISAEPFALRYFDASSHRKSLLAVTSTAIFSAVVLFNLISFYSKPPAGTQTLVVAEDLWFDSAGNRVPGRLTCEGDDARMVYELSDGREISITGTAASHQFLKDEFSFFLEDGTPVKYESVEPYALDCFGKFSDKP